MSSPFGLSQNAVQMAGACWAGQAAGTIHLAGRWVTGRDIRQMVDEQGRPPAATDDMARRLARETGITEAQARELIDFLGLNWASLLREARMLKNRKP